MSEPMQFSVSVNSEEFAKAMDKYPDKIGQAVEEALFLSATCIMNDAILDCPVGVTGDLRKNFRIEQKKGEWEARVVNDLPYARAVEYGTKPHFPPVDALELWGKRVIGEEGLGWALALKISKNGTRAHPYMRPAVSKNENKVKSYFRQAIKKALHG